MHKNLKTLRNTVLRVVGFTYDTPEPEWRQGLYGLMATVKTDTPKCVVLWEPQRPPPQGPLLIDPFQLNVGVHHGHLQNLFTYRILVPTLTQIYLGKPI